MAIWLSRSRGAFDRAQQWIDCADRWVERQGVQYFPGMCRMHRSEVLRIRGRLDDAEREVTQAVRMLEGSLPLLSMIALAELGEVRRRRGDHDAALEAFGRAVQLGWDPQPGMALVLLALISWLILRDRKLGERSKAVWFAVPLTALLINLHPFAIVVPMWVGALLAGASLTGCENTRRAAVT